MHRSAIIQAAKRRCISPAEWKLLLACARGESPVAIDLISSPQWRYHSPHGSSTSYSSLAFPFTNLSTFREQQLNRSSSPCAIDIVRSIFSQPPSTTYDERKLIGYSPDRMFEVVSNVADYYKFVPWCVKSTIVKRNPTNFIECELEVGFQVFVERYISKIRLNPPTSLTTITEDSTLFHHLESLWKFEKGPTADSCWLSFHVDFAFKSPLYKHVAAVFFEEVVQQMMSAFIRRCEVLYGPSSLGPSKSNKSVRLA